MLYGRRRERSTLTKFTYGHGAIFGSIPQTEKEKKVSYAEEMKRERAIEKEVEEHLAILRTEEITKKGVLESIIPEHREAVVKTLELIDKRGVSGAVEYAIREQKFSHVSENFTDAPQGEGT